MLQSAGVLHILTYKCASRQSGVQFFDIWSSKSGPRVWCFAHFDLKMRFPPQRRVVFWHLIFKKWTESVVFCTYWLENVLSATASCHFWTSELQKLLRPRGVLCTNVLRATVSCHFWTSELQKLFRSRGVFCILTCQCASRHSGVPFLTIRTSKIGPNLRCFVHFDWKMCFAPQRRAIFHLSAEQLPPHPPL